MSSKAKLFTQPVAVRNVEREHFLKLRKQLPGLGRCRIMPVAFKFYDNRPLTSDDVFSLGHMLFSQGQMVVQLGAILHQKLPASVRAGVATLMRCALLN